MPLLSLIVSECPANPEPARAIKTLKTINGKPAAQFWQEYDAQPKGKQ